MQSECIIIIKKNLFFYHHSFRPKIFQDPNFFSTKQFYDQFFFYQKLFFTQIFFWPTNFFTNFFLTNIIFITFYWPTFFSNVFFFFFIKNRFDQKVLTKKFYDKIFAFSKNFVLNKKLCKENEACHFRPWSAMSQISIS